MLVLLHKSAPPGWITFDSVQSLRLSSCDLLLAPGAGTAALGVLHEQVEAVHFLQGALVVVIVPRCRLVGLLPLGLFGVNVQEVGHACK